jgi:HAD superfamily hydrolase (TIGR01549 family)
MSEMRPPSFIFDVEGTLIDCVPQILECWQSVLKANGHDLSVETLQSYSGMDPNDMLAELIPGESEARKTQMIKQQGKEYRDSYLPRVKKLPGVRELLQELKKRGHAIALATTCDSAELGHYRTLMEADDLIDAIACGDDVKHGKPHPDLFGLALKRLGETAALVVGDTPYDAIAATQTGTRPLGLLSGGFSRAKLLNAGCVAVFENPEHLLKDGLSMGSVALSKGA